ncbi:MAG: nitroreductase family protein [Spirochaetae bacterium HGW-Spirochaetae-1]|jgi:nitroreductase|nr:MAG: nitroreductase family protein [Spirochaetae bacterium HGW-Spirochaetae-1]
MNVSQAITERRSINFFDPGRTIPDETLNELFRLAGLAPSSFNLQPWEVIAVRSPERKKILRQCAYDQAKVEEASVTLIILANTIAVEENINEVLENRIRQGYMKREDLEKTRKAPFKMYGDPGSEKRTIFAVKNAAFYAMNLMIAARGLGLETHPMDGFESEKVKMEFGIPEHIIIPLLVAVGYPAEDLKLLERPARRDPEKYVMVDRYR